ncbi:C6 finger domain [Mycena venus]|uniref:C6 finger domain n=1 Tax=Mycena venus TaxID=2733690 RepID=A0A8H6YS38_9AGAR|nr:C6 finger domain [Mycena venus]
MDTHNRPLPPILPPIFLTRRRVIIACTNCRKRKIRCLTPEDPPLNPCDRCTKKGLKCEYITIANQRDETLSAGRGSRRGHPPAHGYSHSVRPRDPHWNGSPRMDPLAPPLPQRNVNQVHNLQLPDAMGSSTTQYRYPPIRTQSDSAYTTNDYNYNHNRGSQYQATGLPGTLQPHPYLDPARDFAPLRRYSDDARSAQFRVQDAGGPYGAPQWARCGVCPLGSCRCGWQRD